MSFFGDPCIVRLLDRNDSHLDTIGYCARKEPLRLKKKNTKNKKQNMIQVRFLRLVECVCRPILTIVVVQDVNRGDKTRASIAFTNLDPHAL